MPLTQRVKQQKSKIEGGQDEGSERERITLQGESANRDSRLVLLTVRIVIESMRFVSLLSFKFGQRR